MLSKGEIQESILKVLESQKFGIFTSISELNEPHPTLVAYHFSNDLTTIVFATPKNTRKFNNLILHSNVSFFWDNRTNSGEDISHAFTVSAIGSAAEVPDNLLKEIKTKYLARHPYMEDFIESPFTALISVTIKRFELVSQFQNVLEYVP